MFSPIKILIKDCTEIFANAGECSNSTPKRKGLNFIFLLFFVKVQKSGFSELILLGKASKIFY